MERIHRSQIKTADYNPRTLDKHARKKLRDNLKKNGLVETLVWNRTTGTLVGGHQRIAMLDELEGTQDYYLDVAVIEVDAVREKELNLALNNQTMAGDWDMDALGKLLEGIDFREAGFDTLDMEEFFPDKDFSVLKTFAAETDASVKDDAETIARMKKDKKAAKAKSREQDNAGFMFSVVFADALEAGRFLRGIGVEDTAMCVDGRRLANLCGIDVEVKPEG